MIFLLIMFVIDCLQKTMSSSHQRKFKININMCAYEELKALPGVCQVLADGFGISEKRAMFL